RGRAPLDHVGGDHLVPLGVGVAVLVSLVAGPGLVEAEGRQQPPDEQAKRGPVHRRDPPPWKTGRPAAGQRPGPAGTPPPSVIRRPGGANKQRGIDPPRALFLRSFHAAVGPAGRAPLARLDPHPEEFVPSILYSEVRKGMVIRRDDGQLYYVVDREL